MSIFTCIYVVETQEEMITQFNQQLDALDINKQPNEPAGIIITVLTSCNEFQNRCR